MFVISKKLQLRMICSCGKRFGKVYGDAQINTKQGPDGEVQFVYARCPKCDLYEEVIINEIKKDLVN